jgi:NADH-quinone oxidoreductase subunit E
VSLPVRPETDRRIHELLGRFPQRGSALLPALHLIQDEKGSVSLESMAYVAETIGLSPAFVASVVSFYTLFHREPVGRYHIQVCRTLPCALRGAGDLVAHLEARLGIKKGQTTPDGRFSLACVECLGACDTAPMLQINDEDHGPLDARKVDAILERFE